MDNIVNLHSVLTLRSFRYNVLIDQAISVMNMFNESDNGHLKLFVYHFIFFSC